MPRKRWTCFKCGVEYARWQDLRGHLIMKHDYQDKLRKQFSCPKCGWWFDDETDYRNHLELRHQVKEH